MDWAFKSKMKFNLLPKGELFNQVHIRSSNRDLFESILYGNEFVVYVVLKGSFASRNLPPKHLHQSRLARAIGPRNGVHVSGVEFPCETSENPFPVKSLSQVGYLYGHSSGVLVEKPFMM